MTPTGPYVRHTLDYTLRLGLGLPRYAVLPHDVSKITEVYGDASEFFLSNVKFILTERYDVQPEAAEAVRLMEALSR